MARLFADENFPRDVVDVLRRLGHDVLTLQEVGEANRGTPDSEVLDFAVTDLRAVLTDNRRHFLKLHRQRPGHTGIIVCTVDKDHIGKANRIHEALSAFEELRGVLIRVNRPSQ